MLGEVARRPGFGIPFARPTARKPDEQRKRSRCQRGPRRAPAGRAGRVAAAAVVVPAFLLPAQRLLRAAAGTGCDGRVERCRSGVSAGDDRLLRRAWHLAEGTDPAGAVHLLLRSEEHTSELQSLMRISYAVFCLKKKKQNK